MPIAIIVIFFSFHVQFHKFAPDEYHGYNISLKVGNLLKYRLFFNLKLLTKTELKCLFIAYLISSVRDREHPIIQS